VAHAHDHAHRGIGASPFQSASQRNRGRLAFVFLFTLAVAIVEVVGGLLTNSLALLADAGHMVTDTAGLGMALTAVWFASRPATSTRSYGLYRLEILAALVNAVVVMGVAAYILFESVQRFSDPPSVAATGMVAIAAVGLAVNLIGLRLLSSCATESLNLRGAYLELLTDTLGSVAAIAAGLIVLTTDWRYADPLFGSAIALVMVPRAWRLMWDALHVLMEGTPSHIDAGAVQQAMLDLPHVRAVHDLHIWAITSGMDVLSCHLVVDDPAYVQDHLREVGEMLLARFDIQHMTVQIEGPDFVEAGPPF
jgi:cobalt-zinc-cadmium efflux system protein